MGLVFGLRGALIYTETYLMSKYKDEWLFEAIEEIKVQQIRRFQHNFLLISLVDNEAETRSALLTAHIDYNQASEIRNKRLVQH